MFGVRRPNATAFADIYPFCRPHVFTSLDDCSGNYVQQQTIGRALTVLFCFSPVSYSMLLVLWLGRICNVDVFLIIEGRCMPNHTRMTNFLK